MSGREHRCWYECPCGWSGSEPVLRHPEHLGRLEALDDPEYEMRCRAGCQANNEESACSMSDCVCYAAQTGQCPHCAGPAQLMLLVTAEVRV